MRLFDMLLDAMAALAALVLLLVMFAIGTDVSLRALGAGSLLWTLEFSEHALLFMLFFGMPWLAREGGHITVELVTDRLPMSVRHRLARIVAALVALLLFWLSFWAARLSLADWNAGILTIGIFPIPRYLLSLTVGSGLFLTAIVFLRQAVSGRLPETSKEAGVA